MRCGRELLAGAMQNAASELTARRDNEKARPVTPETMRAAVVEKFREPLQIREVPVPSSGPAQALVQIIATACVIATCTRPDGDWPVEPKPPFISRVTDDFNSLKYRPPKSGDRGVTQYPMKTNEPDIWDGSQRELARGRGQRGHTGLATVPC